MLSLIKNLVNCHTLYLFLMLHLYPFLMIHHLFRYNLFLKYLQLILTFLDLNYLHFLSYPIHFLIVYVLSQILP